MPVWGLLTPPALSFALEWVLYFSSFQPNFRILLDRRVSRASRAILWPLVNFTTSLNEPQRVHTLSVREWQCCPLWRQGCGTEFGGLSPNFVVFLICLIYNTVRCLLSMLYRLKLLGVWKMHLIFLSSSCWCHYWILLTVLPIRYLLI